MEERILYFDIINGISGDMTLSSLLDLGIPKEIFLEELSKLNLDNEFEIIITNKNENGINGININIIFKEKNIHRYLIDIFNIIDSSSLNTNVKEMAKKIFMVIGEAEAKVHGTTIDKIHFHEVGAIDSIIDIVGTCILVDLLCVDKICATIVPVGSGFVKCEHGVIPVPSPATLEILKNVPIQLNSVKGECTTPTGAAIIKVLCNEFIEKLEFEPQQIGYGIGDKKFEIPNMLRSIVGVKKNENIVYEIVCNIDDMSSEVYSYLYEKVLEEGALDIYIESIYMKKNRPASKVCILCKKTDLEKFTQILLKETSTFGVRYNIYNRKELKRKFKKINTKYGDLTIKLGYYNGNIIKATPEYEECRIIAKNNDKSLNELLFEINCLIRKKFVF